MGAKWLSGANVVDLSGSRGNGPFRDFRGVALHVNVDEHGTPISFWKNNGGQVTPNFQVMKDGHVDQLLPFNWQPWCQVNGNFNYAAIETAGLPGEPLTLAQMKSIARILKIYHDDYGMVLQVANTPGQRGFITHAAGGQAWGGHACPGTIRSNQRDDILRLITAPPKPTPHHPEHAILHEWPSWMPNGHAFGNVTGPDHIHGGIDSRERHAVKLIQQRFIELDCVPGVHNPNSNWADGIWEAATTVACKLWHRKHFVHAMHPDQITHTAWQILFRK